MTARIFVARGPLPQIILFVALGLPGVIGLGTHFFVEPKSTLSFAANTMQSLCLLFVPFLMWKPRLIVSAQELVVQFGTSRTSIPLTSIRGVRDTRASSRGVAAWFAGIEITHGRWDTMQVFPVEREAFVASLRERLPAIAGK